MTDADLILAGGGLANGLIALRLRQQQPALKVLLLESADRPGGNHTWSFHHADLSAQQHHWVAPLVAHRWPGYDVHFPAFSRALSGEYLSVTSARFAQVLSSTLGEALRSGCRVCRVTPTAVELNDGRCLSARAVIDGRGYQPGPWLMAGCQSFLGQQWQTGQPHGLTRPILMDATVDQRAGYRFIYTLPLTPHSLLIEDTHYVDQALRDDDAARQQIARYAVSQGWQLQRLEREERGDLPIALAGDPHLRWQQAAGQPQSGLRAGLFHPTTGYSLPLAVALAEQIAAQPFTDAATLFALIQRFAVQQWQQQRFFRLLNRMLFLAGEPAARWQVMQRFYRLDSGLIERFYAGQPRRADMMRILAGKPPVPLGEALQAVLKITPRIRGFK